MFKSWKHVLRINGLGLIKLIGFGFLGKPSVNGLGDKLSNIYKRCTHVQELIT